MISYLKSYFDLLVQNNIRSFIHTCKMRVDFKSLIEMIEQRSSRKDAN